jgi:hypothetical protein
MHLLKREGDDQWGNFKIIVDIIFILNKVGQLNTTTIICRLHTRFNFISLQWEKYLS